MMTCALTYGLTLLFLHWDECLQERGRTENNREAKFYKPTGAGRKALKKETLQWRGLSSVSSLKGYRDEQTPHATPCEAEKLSAARRADGDFEREIDAHLVFLEQEYLGQWHTAAEARHRARLACGGVESIRQAQRDERSFLWSKWPRTMSLSAQLKLCYAK